MRATVALIAVLAAGAAPAAASGPIVEIRDCSAPYGVGEVWVANKRVLNICWYPPA